MGRNVSLLSVWRPDALVAAQDYATQLARALHVFREQPSAGLCLVLGVDPARPLIEVTGTSVGREGLPGLLAEVPHGAPGGGTFPAPPPPRDMGGIGWRLGCETRSAQWTLGPVVAEPDGLELFALMLTGTLTRYDCPLGFVDMQLCDRGR